MATSDHERGTRIYLGERAISTLICALDDLMFAEEAGPHPDPKYLADLDRLRGRLWTARERTRPKEPSDA